VTVLYFADTRFPIERANGVQTMATCHALAARGHDVTLVVRPDSAPAARDPFAFYGLPPLATLRVTTVPATAHGRARRAQYLLGAMRIALASRTATVYTRDLGLASFLLQLPRGRRPAVLYESHGLAPIVAAEMPELLGKPSLAPSASKLRRLDRREARVWRRADGYVTITAALLDDLTARYGARDNAHVVPDGAWTQRYHRTDARRSPPIAGYAGHLYPWKGVDDFVRALALSPGIRGLIVGGHPGEADLARVQGLIDKLNLHDRVEIAGLVPPDEVLTRVSAASMLVLPNVASTMSSRYTSPLKLFEYLTTGRPIVATDSPAIREVLTDDVTALLVAPGDPAAMAAAMQRVATDAALAGRLGEAAAALAPEYDWSRRAERLEPVLEAVQR
jgi:glycosyltransferase involved in cell wall biosynthesis